jgi:excisionase family DNA binding protein
MEPRLSVQELSEIWGVSRQHVYNLLEDEKEPLPSIRVGKAIRFRPCDIIEYEETRRCPGPVRKPSS